MGVDKALLEFCGRPLVEIAVEKLRGFCAAVSIVGERDDLAAFAQVVTGERTDCGPGAGIEAGLKAATEEWCLFVPVDVPLVPGELLQRWAKDGLRRSSGKYFGGSYLQAQWIDHPSFCFLPRKGAAHVSEQLDRGQRRLTAILSEVRKENAVSWIVSENAENFMGLVRPTKLQMDFWFQNLNSPFEFDEAEAWARHLTDDGG